MPEPSATASGGSGGSGGTSSSGGNGGTSADIPDATTPDACVVDGCPVPILARPRIDQLEISEAAWSALAASEGDTYWYEEENCGGPGVVGGTVQTIQIENGVGRSVGERTISQDECTSGIARYGVLMRPYTMPELYDECRGVILYAASLNYGDVKVITDDRGVIQTCSWFVPNPTCFDQCGEGFVLRTWSFGTPDDDQDAGTR